MSVFYWQYAPHLSYYLYGRNQSCRVQTLPLWYQPISSHGSVEMLKTKQTRSNSTKICCATKCLPAGLDSKIGLDRFFFQLHSECQGMAPNTGRCVCKQSRSFLEVHHTVFSTSEIGIWLHDGKKKTAYVWPERHFRDDTKGSELICIAEWS